MIKKLQAILLPLLLACFLVGCAAAQDSGEQSSATQTSETTSTATDTVSRSNITTDESSTSISSVAGSILDTSGFFTDRDLETSPDLTDATYITLNSNEDVTIRQEGIYVLSGKVNNVTIIVDTDGEAKVQLVLDGVSITNEDAPAIYVKAADKVFVTTTDSGSYLEVSGSYEADGETNLDAVIFSKADLVLNGTGALEIVSDEGNGVTSKDDLKITGGSYSITSALDSIEANDSILIYDGNITITTGKDGLHSENDEDASLGNIYILNGTLNISAADDAIRGTSIVQIDGGTINIETCMEGIEGTYLQINGGEITIYAKDDGINASAKSTYDVVNEVNGGTINVTMGSGDTDAFDSNGNIYINGGTIDITAPTSAFDADGTAQLNGGDVTVNGEIITQITQTQMGGQMGGQNPGGGKPR